jgi:hypothetical protein
MCSRGTTIVEPESLNDLGIHSDAHGCNAATAVTACLGTRGLFWDCSCFRALIASATLTRLS